MNGIMKSKMTADSTRQATARQSNLELMRIVLMLVIIAHHLVVNSGLIDAIAPAHSTRRSICCAFWYVAQSRYQRIRNDYRLLYVYLSTDAPKDAQAIGHLLFLGNHLRLAFIFAGRMSINECVMGLLYPITSINKGFTAPFLFMYLLIPFMNDDRGSR